MRHASNAPRTSSTRRVAGRPTRLHPEAELVEQQRAWEADEERSDLFREALLILKTEEFVQSEERRALFHAINAAPSLVDEVRRANGTFVQTTPSKKKGGKKSDRNAY